MCGMKAEWDHLVEEMASKRGRGEMGKAVGDYRGNVILHSTSYQ